MTETWFLRDLPGVAHGPGTRRALSLEPGGVVEWTPLQLPQLALWISPRGTGTLRGEPSGDPFTGSFETGYAELIGNGDTAVFVSQADDLSGNGHHATQTTGGNQPELVHDGTRWAFRFSGADQVLRVLEATGLGPSMNGLPYTLIMGTVLTQTLPDNDARFVFGTFETSGGTDGRSRIHFPHRNTNEFTHAHWGSDVNYTRAKDNNRHVFVCQYGDPGSLVRVDGTELGTNSDTPDDLDEVGDVLIGRGSFNSWIGDVYDVVLCASHADAELGTSDIEQAEAYIDAAGELGVL